MLDRLTMFPAGATACLLSLVLLSDAVLAEDQPNVLLLFTDDQCFDTIAELGNPEIKTPNMDRLARRGVAFSNAYNMGGWNGAVCIASRTMMNTGRFLWRAFEVQKHSDEVAKRGRFLSQLMSQQGYETYVSGKWHVRQAADSIFDHVKHIRPGMPKTVPSAYQRPNEDDDWSPWDRELGGFWEGGKHWSEVLADDAEEFLGQAAESERPFFMYLAFNAPHDPRQSPREFVEMYPRDEISVPENFLPEYPEMQAIGAGKSLRDERLAPWPRTEEAVRLHRQEYYALITHTDEQIGRILDALEESDQADNTYIVLVGDHGLACGQHGLMGKQNMYEHSMKAPLIVVGPELPEGQVIETPVYIQDFFPTALEWAGGSVPDFVDFRSLLPLLGGERDQQYDAIYGAYLEEHQRMIRVGDWKLIHYPRADRYRLFDLASDPWEKHDLAAEPEYATKLQDLKLQLRKLKRSMDDPTSERLRNS